MSLYGALFSGVSGLSAQSAAMGAISDNISNVNTIGYKDTMVNFQTLVTHQVSQTEYSPGGVQSKPRTNVDTQGLLQASSSSTDVAISGTGFFIVNSKSDNTDGEFAYTRAGSFKVDQNGYLENVSGWYLQGWPLTNWDGTASADYQTINGTTYMAAYKNSANGSYTYINPGEVDPTDLQPLNLNNIAGTAQATTSISMGANLPSGSTVGHTEQQPVAEYDSLGNSHNIATTWTYLGQNQWSYSATPPEGATTLSLMDEKGNVYESSGRLDFSSVPTSGQFTMNIGGSTYSFTVGSGTDGSSGNDFYINPTAANNSTASLAQTAAAEIEKAYLTQYDSVSATPTVTGTGGTFKGTANSSFASGTKINLTDSAGTAGSVTIDISGMTLSQAATAIQAGMISAGDTGFTCAVDGTGTGLQFTDTDNTATFTATGAGDLSALSLTGVGAGGTYDLASPGMSATAPATVTVVGPKGTTGSLDITGKTPAAAATAINDLYSTTGVHAYVNDGNIVLYSDQQGVVTAYGDGFAGSDTSDTFGINGTTGATAPLTFTGDGYTYAQQVPGTGSVVFSNFDTNNTVTVSGLTSLLSGSPPGSQSLSSIVPPFASGDSVTISGPLSTGTGTSIDLSGLSLSQAMAAINAQTATTGVGAYLNGTTVEYYTTVPGHVSVSGVGWPTGPYSFTATGTKVLEQAYAPSTPDTFSLSKVASTVYSGTDSTKASGPNTPAIVFNGDGTPSQINIASMSITWANGAQDQTTTGAAGVSPPISLNFGSVNSNNGMTQLAGKYGLTFMDQNGAKFGNLSSLTIGADGIVTANFDNGVTRPIFQIPIATFVDPDGLQSVSGNVYLASDFSGLPTVRVAGTSGSGTLNQSSLEASTVDIGTQFTQMIVTQRAYSAAAKIITTADQMLDDLINIKR